MSQNLYFISKAAKFLEGFETINYDQTSRAVGRDIEPKRGIVTCYKCGVQHFVGHYCASKMVMTLDKIVIEGIFEQKVSLTQPLG